MKNALFIIAISFLLISLYSCKLKESNKNIEKIKPNLKITEALQFCTTNNMNTNFCILVDMGTHSGIERLVVWDFKKDSLLKVGLVSHGCGTKPWSSDFTKDSPKFSNVPESHLSSVGKYVIGNREWSNWGIHVKYWLKGLEETNNNAEKRVIVLHGWEKVEDKATYPDGTPEGWGCPAVSNNMMKFIDKQLKVAKKPVLLWIYK